jgi:large subunit ribosomal protein L13
MKNIERKTHTLDASDQTVGRLSTKIANLLRGKHKPEFVPHIDLGDVVYVKNVDKLKFTGKKLEQKNYYHFTGYVGNLKTKKMSDIFAKNPADLIRRAVKQMLPNTRLRNDMMKRLIIR